jgi:hypothetical protein
MFATTSASISLNSLISVPLASVVGFSVTSHTFWFKPLQRKENSVTECFSNNNLDVRNDSRLTTSVQITDIV